MRWYVKLAQEMKIKHSDYLAVIRSGRSAKKRTRRRERHSAKRKLQKDEGAGSDGNIVEATI